MRKAIIYILIFSITLPVYGANEIRAFVAGAADCFAVVREIDGDVWYPTGQVFEVWGTSARTAADYGIALTDKSGDMFVGDFNANISAGQYYIITYQQAGANPADTDPAVWQDYGYWDGSLWTSGPDASNIDTIAIDVAGLDGEAMRGTDGISLVVPDPAGTAATLHAATDALISALNNLSSAQAQAAAAAALTVYDPATRTEATADKDEVLAAVGDIEVDNDAIAAAVWNAICEGAYSFKDYMRTMAAVLNGKMSGGGTSQIKVKDAATGTIDRMTTTVDSHGNRTAVTLNPD